MSGLPTLPESTSRVPERISVLGGGRMGAGIAHAFLLAGASVQVVERDEAAAGAARERIIDSLQRSVERGATSRSVTAMESALSVAVAVEDVSESLLVIEALPEDRDLKKGVLRRVESAVGSEAMLASNTSSISIDLLAEGLDRPERFVGLHFFNPVPASRLVEIVVGKATSPALSARSVEWVEALGKRPIVVRDSPGFASSRLGVALALEAIRMCEEGVASAADIDAALELGYRHPMGPLRTTDVVGLDVRLAIAEELERTLGPRFSPPTLLRTMVAEGRVGRKAGAGFYEWPDAEA